jgi:hypothetical protein
MAAGETLEASIQHLASSIRFLTADVERKGSFLHCPFSTFNPQLVPLG